MIFTTYWFVLFAAIFFPIYWSLKWPVVRKFFLLFACGVFHFHFAGPAGVLPIIILGSCVYLIGLTRSSWLCVAGIALSVVCLCFYKYMSFFVNSFFLPLGTISSRQDFQSVTLSFLPSAPPLAISFFTFEFVHYLYDVRKGKPSIRNFGDFCLFTFFFPSLVAGPIKRYEAFLPALHRGLKRFHVRAVCWGILLVALGFFKKNLADNLTLWLDFSVPHMADETLFARWQMFAGMAFRILLDFSGYSDMAIGFAQMAGIRLQQNFNWPYLASNIQDFWHRWHISLSTWIRDYIYIPLGGSHHGWPRRIANYLIAFGLCGLWHGAAWNYVLWGLYHAIGLGGYSFYARFIRPSPAGRGYQIGMYMGGMILTNLFVWFGWLLFFYPTVEAFCMAKLLFYKTL